MPNTSSAKKALRVSSRKREINKLVKNQVRKTLKELRKDLRDGAKNSSKLLSEVFSSLDKAVKRNIYHKNKVARKKSRINSMVKQAVTKN